MGAHKRGLKPQIFRENRGEILPAKSGLFGANWGLFRAYRGLFGADRDQFLRTPQPRGKSRNCPERALFGPIGAFWAKPRLPSPRLDFPEKMAQSCETPGQLQGSKTPKPEIPRKKTQKLLKKYYFSGIFSIFLVFFKEFRVGVRGVIFEFFSRSFGFRGFGSL